MTDTQPTHPNGDISPPPEVWQRTHPLGMILESVSSVPQFLVALLVFGDVSDGLFNSLAEVLVLVVAFGAGVARWFSTRYAVSPDALHFRSGIIFRGRQVLPRNRIQNVTTKAKILDRVFSLTQLVVSDASESGEIAIPRISYREADRLTTLLRPIARKLNTDNPDPAGDDLPMEAPTGTPVLDAQVLLAPRLKSIIATMSTANSALYPALFLTALIVLIAAVWRFPNPWLESVMDTANIAVPSISPSQWSITTVAFAVVWLAPVGGALVRPIEQVLRLGSFRLSATPDRLHIQAGLATEAKLTARRERIQQIRVGRDALHRRLGLETVSFQTADTTNEVLNDRQGFIHLAPTLPSGGWQSLIASARALDEIQIDVGSLQSVSPRTVRRARIRMAFSWFPWVAVIAAFSLVAAAVMLTVLGAAIVWAPVRRYRRLGWAKSDDQFVARSGILSEELRLVLLDKVQVVKTRANIFQRRLHLADLVLVTAGQGRGGMVVVPDLPAEEAKQLASVLSHRAAETPRAATL